MSSTVLCPWLPKLRRFLCSASQVAPLEANVAGPHGKPPNLQVDEDVVALPRQVHRVLKYLVDDRLSHRLVLETCSRCNDLPVELDGRWAVSQYCLHLLGLECTS